MITFGYKGNAGEYLGEGWAVPEDGYTWTVGTRATLSIPSPGPRACRMKIRYGAFIPPDRGFQRAAVSLGEMPVANWIVSQHGEVDLWLRREVIAQAGDPMLLKIELPDAASPQSFMPENRDDRILGLSFRTLEIEALPDDAETAALADMARNMESLGSNCEFGLVQRYCGAEPLGLLRFSTSYLNSLLPALDARFKGIGEPEALDFAIHGEGPNEEWMTMDRRYGFLSHTLQRPKNVTREHMLRVESHRLPRLAEKLTDDLDAGEKIFVYQDVNVRDAEAALPLVDAIRRYNPTNVLLLVLADPEKAGRVERHSNGLMVGYVHRLTERAHAAGLTLAPWLSVIREAAALRAQANEVASQEPEIKRGPEVDFIAAVQSDSEPVHEAIGQRFESKPTDGRVNFSYAFQRLWRSFKIPAGLPGSED